MNYLYYLMSLIVQLSIRIKIYCISIERESTHWFASTCFIHTTSKTFFSAWIYVYLSLLSYSILVMESILCETTSFTSVNGNCFEWRGQFDMSQSIWQRRGKHRGFISNDSYVSFFWLSEKPDRKWTFEIHVNSFLLVMYGIYMQMKTRYILLNLFYTVNV